MIEDVGRPPSREGPRRPTFYTYEYATLEYSASQSLMMQCSVSLLLCVG